MKPKIIMISSVFSVLLLSFILASFYYAPSFSSISATPLEYEANVCTQVVRGDGTRLPADCSHNLLVPSGKNMTRDLFQGGGGLVSNISVCNATSVADSGTCPVASSTAFTSFGSCDMQDNAGTFVDFGVGGNWTLTTTYTSACANVVTNTTQLKNATGSVLAANSFTSVTLQATDTLTINWSIGIS